MDEATLTALIVKAITALDAQGPEGEASTGNQWIDRTVQEPDAAHTPVILGWDDYWNLPLVFIWFPVERRWVVESEVMMEGIAADTRQHAFRLWLPVPAHPSQGRDHG